MPLPPAKPRANKSVELKVKARQQATAIFQVVRFMTESIVEFVLESADTAA